MPGGQRATASLELRRSDDEAIDITPFVDTFVWRESMLAGGFSWRLRFKTNAWNEWDALMLGRDRPAFQFRLRSEEDGGPVSTEWRTAIVDKSRAAWRQDISMAAELKGADKRLLMAQTARVRAWPARSVAQLVQLIAAEHGLQPVADNTAAVSDWLQTHENDWAFLRRCVRVAASESSRGDVYLWMDENNLRFGAPQLTDISERRYDMSVVENRVDRYVVGYAGREADRRGAATLLGIGWDWDQKRAVTFTMNESTAQTQPSLARSVPRRMSDGLRVIPIFQFDPKVVEEEVRARWGRVAPRYMDIRIDTRPDLTLKPNTILSMESNLDERRQTPFMGRYAALEVQHVMLKGAISTTAVGYRREAQQGEAQPTGSNADTLGTRDEFQLAGTRPRTILVATELPS